jgi:hypothetical protein
MCRERAPFLTWEMQDGIVFAQQTEHARDHGVTVGSKVLLEGANSAEQRSAVRGIGDHTPSQWSDGASLTLVLVLSLGFWAAIWRAIASLASRLPV